jgi:hypothetical protein
MLKRSRSTQGDYMTVSRKSAWYLTILSCIAAIMMSAPANAAACPLFLIKSCVVTKAGVRETQWTNACLAKRQGERYLHVGACQGPICTLLWDPVCSINPFTHMQETYSSLCWSDIGNATLVHKGACK